MAIRSRHNGFSFVELIITVALIVVLSSIFVPSYASYVSETKRSQMQQHMMTISNLQEQYFSDNRSYTDDLSANGLNIELPESLNDRYTIAVSFVSVPPSYLISATAIGSQADDGDLTVSSDGTKSPADYW